MPVYDEDFVFERVTMESLSTVHVLEVTVWDALFVAQPMGVLRLGPHPNGSKPWMDSHVRYFIVSHDHTTVYMNVLAIMYHHWSTHAITSFVCVYRVFCFS